MLKASRKGKETRHSMEAWKEQSLLLCEVADYNHHLNQAERYHTGRYKG